MGGFLNRMGEDRVNVMAMFFDVILCVWKMLNENTKYLMETQG